VSGQVLESGLSAAARPASIPQAAVHKPATEERKAAVREGALPVFPEIRIQTVTDKAEVHCRINGKMMYSAKAGEILKEMKTGKPFPDYPELKVKEIKAKEGVIVLENNGKLKDVSFAPAAKTKKK
jgi:hypothetical protein